MSDKQPHLLLRSTVAHKNQGWITLQSWSALVHSALSNPNYTVSSSGQDLHSRWAEELHKGLLQQDMKATQPQQLYKDLLKHLSLLLNHLGQIPGLTFCVKIQFL